MSFSDSKIKRRDFLKIMGWSGVGATLAGCDMPTTVTLEEGKEDVVSYLSPEEYAVPGIGVWYASTCQQCPAGCGVHGRVREGRVLKLEGNPESEVNRGKLCQMGQSALQTHYNPDRITSPKAREEGALKDISWDEAYAMLEKHVGPASGIRGDRFAWMTGTVSGHQSVLLDAHLGAMGSTNHYVHETINNSIWQDVCQDMLGDANPELHFNNAKIILSFGADFLGTWSSPVHFSTEYAKFRNSPRGTLIQIEPKMTLTGANADHWVPIRPGTEGILALGIANLLINEHHRAASAVPASVVSLINKYNPATVTSLTGVPGEQVSKIARLLNERSPSLVISGASAEGHENGYQNAVAAMLLNIIRGNVGKTIKASGQFPFPQMTAKQGNTRDLVSFAKAADQKRYDAVFFYGTNPVFTAPVSLGLTEKLKNIPFKVAFSQFEDETTMQADLVLPMASALEDWGTHVPAYQSSQNVVNIQQPLMEPLSDQTKGFGDVVLALLKQRQSGAYSTFEDYYSYLRHAFVSLPASIKGAANDEAFWAKALQQGVLNIHAAKGSLRTRAVNISMPDAKQDDAYPYYLIPSARLGLWDGRHANLPWLQEAPDQISKVVWDSWAEMHPKMANKLGVKSGDIVNIASASGTIKAQVYVFKGMHPDAIAVPMGQGHEHYGRYAKGRGVNPLEIINPAVDSMTGELALFATRVKVSSAGEHQTLVHMGGSETQLGRKIVATVPADVFERTEGGA